MELFPIQRGVVATNQAEKKFISERFGSETLNKNCNNVRRALKTKALTLKHLKANFTDFLGGEFRNELMTFYEVNISSGPVSVINTTGPVNWSIFAPKVPTKSTSTSILDHKSFQSLPKISVPHPALT